MLVSLLFVVGGAVFGYVLAGIVAGGAGLVVALTAGRYHVPLAALSVACGTLLVGLVFSRTAL